MAMKRDTLLRTLCKLGACDDSIEWIKSTDFKTAQEIWDNCPRGDWMLWLAGRCPSVERKTLVRCAVACARPALKYTTDPRVAACLDTVDRWLEDEATIEEVREARKADADAAAAAYHAATIRTQARAEQAATIRTIIPQIPVK